MITAKLKTILTASGCTLVLYESDALANLLTDRCNQTDVVGVIMQLNEITLELKANALLEHYVPLIIEVLQQVKLEDSADNNETKLQALLNVCKTISYALIATGEYKQLKPMTLTKIRETKYDANLIGWSMTLDLTYLLNENKC